MIDLKKIQFNTDKGTAVKFKFVAPPPLDLSAEMQLSTFDMNPGDRYHFALGKVREGIEKIVFGPAHAARRAMTLRQDGAELSDAIVIGLDAITFGSDDEGYFATFSMATGLKNFDEAGTMKLPKAYYDRDERNFNLFPAEDHEDLAVLKAESEAMIGNYLRKIGSVYSRMIIEAMGKDAADALDRLRDAAPAAPSKSSSGVVILNMEGTEA